MASKPRRPQPESSLPCKPQNSHQVLGCLRDITNLKQEHIVHGYFITVHICFRLLFISMCSNMYGIVCEEIHRISENHSV